jgi:cytochrome c oxidase subunit I+III
VTPRSLDVSGLPSYRYSHASLMYWDADAYGSVVWLLLGLHTTHLVTDVYDTVVLAAVLFFSRPLEGRRHVDVAENSLYWYFVVWSWLPIYAVIYLAPRLL